VGGAEEVARASIRSAGQRSRRRMVSDAQQMSTKSGAIGNAVLGAAQFGAAAMEAYGDLGTVSVGGHETSVLPWARENRYVGAQAGRALDTGESRFGAEQIAVNRAMAASLERIANNTASRGGTGTQDGGPD